MTSKEALELIYAYSDDDVYHNIEKEVKIIEKDLEKLEKLEKVIEILKTKFFIDLIERQEDGKLGFVPINPIENQPIFAKITKEEFDLLKEVLDDGRDLETN